MEELKQYDLLVLSDIGANTLLLPGATFTRSEMMPNRCNLIRDYVLEGGALLMVGGYMTFSGIDGKGKWQDTAVQEVLPVQVLSTDDRMEHCEGIRPVTVKQHEILEGLGEWPRILGYNKTILRDGAELLAEVEGQSVYRCRRVRKGPFRRVYHRLRSPTGLRRNSATGRATISCFQNMAKWLTNK